jgi:hypothetical protein
VYPFTPFTPSTFISTTSQPTPTRVFCSQSMQHHTSPTPLPIPPLLRRKRPESVQLGESGREREGSPFFETSDAHLSSSSISTSASSLSPLPLPPSSGQANSRSTTAVFPGISRHLLLSSYHGGTLVTVTATGVGVGAYEIAYHPVIQFAPPTPSPAQAPKHPPTPQRQRRPYYLSSYGYSSALRANTM